MSRISVKSKYHAEFKRYFIKSDFGFEKFEETIKEHHNLQEIPFLIFYTDPIHGDLLPINNDENFAKAKSVQKSILKIVIQAKGESYNDVKKRNFLENLTNGLLTASNSKTPKLEINLMEDFHQVSSIIDADILPKTCRRVRITKHGSDKPLGFYIRTGFSLRLTPDGIKRVPSIFISKVLSGGLAESTGLLAPNDEVLEVNGIDILGKSLEQVTDMMVANASNLTLTIKPVTQNHLNDSFMSTKSNTNSLQRNHLQHQQNLLTPQRNTQFEQHLNGLKTQEDQSYKSINNVNMLQMHYTNHQNNIPYQNNISFQNNVPYQTIHPQTIQQQNILQPTNHNQHLQPTVLQNSFQSNVIQSNNPQLNVLQPTNHNQHLQHNNSTKRTYFGVEEHEDDESDDQEDEVVNHFDFVKNLNDLKLRNYYQNNNVNNENNRTRTFK